MESRVGLTCCSDVCVDTRSATDACGACDRRCLVSNATAGCAAGQCTVASCTAPFGDCDGAPANGCEVDTTASLAHCGACATACVTPHGTPSCAAGRCTVARCDDGFGDCDGSPANGCEVDLRTTPARCGQCSTACPSSAPACVFGSCVAALNVTVSRNLSTEALTPGRTCAEAFSVPVATLGAMNATVGVTLTAGCMVAGDTVLLINLQGSPGATVNVGNYELLTVATVMGTAVTFVAPKVRRYGSGVGDDANIGAGAGQQRVVLQRVPVFGDVTVRAGATLTVSAWDGQRGGVLAFRAGRVTLDGALSVEARGYRNGGYSVDDGSCSENVATEPGESIEGPGGASLLASAGASGGLSALSGVSFNANTPLQASAGHATVGEPGQNPVGRTIGAAGGAYGVRDGTRLTLGSGAGGNVTCRGGSFAPFLDARSSVAGGVVALWADAVTLGATGAINANGSDGSRTPASGGYVLLRANTVSLRAGLVSARGSMGESSAGSATVRNRGAVGYIAIVHRDAVVGTTAPPAFERAAPDPFAP